MGEKTIQEEILERLARIESKMDKIADHEKRLRFLEKGFWILIGAIGLIEILAKYIHK